MMSEKETFPLQEPSPALFETAANRNAEAIAELLGNLNMAYRSKLPWPEEIRRLYEKGLNQVAERFDPSKLQDIEISLLKAAKDASMDAPILRDRYAALAKLEFSTYKDPATLCQALGLRDNNVPMRTVNIRWSMMQQLLKLNNYCFDKNLSRGRICLLDDITGEIVAAFDKRRTIPLSKFFEEYTIVIDLSVLHSILATHQLPVRRTDDNLKARLEACMLHECVLPNDVLKTILIPDFVSEAYYQAQIINITAPSYNIEAPQKETAPAVKAQSVIPRWDESRTVLELTQRLKPLNNLQLETEPDTANLLKVFRFSSTIQEQAENFAVAFASLDSLASVNELPWIDNMAKELSEAIVWQKPELCNQISDKLGKLVYNWFHITILAKGSQYLAHCVIKMPYRLWTHAEKAFATAKEDDALTQAVKQELGTGHVNADVLYWLWRSKNKDMQELKNKYLGTPDFLFKTLQRPVKGNFLKAQRELKKLLTDDPDFQRQVVRQGDPNATKELVRCTKRLPLLNTGEKQSVLLKLAELYPEHIDLIEERQAAPRFANIDNITSIRSYNQLKENLKKLIEVEIPENGKAIGRAAEMGDLRENSEFKFAKERQKYLSKQATDWQKQLDTLTPTDFSNFNSTQFVEPGAMVTLTYTDTKEQETYCILGILDTIAEKKIISFAAPLGQALLHKEIKSTVQLPNGRTATITKIEGLSDELKAYVAGK